MERFLECLKGPSYYMFFAAIMCIAAMLFLVYIRNYKEVSYIQE